MRRVVVTGIGLVTPVGVGTDNVWRAVRAGTSGIGPITRFDASEYAVRIAAEVKDFQVEEFLDKKTARNLDLFAQYAVAAAKLAIEDAHLDLAAEDPTRLGAITGCGLGGLPTIETYHQVFLQKGPRRITPFFIPLVIPNMSAGHISIIFGTKGPNLSVTTACAAGTHAVGLAMREIQHGSCDVAITGGSESTICPLAVGGFNAMKALSKRNDEPHRASRPFDRDRDGFIIAEGAGMLVLEELEHARRRNATIYAEVVGFGLTGDAYHIAAPPEDGDGAARCMAMALADAGIQPEAVDYINAHGTSTGLNDVCETRAIKTVFGDHAQRLAVSSTKSVTGHMLGGAGGIEAVFTALAVRDQVAPPTMNLENPDPECDLDYVPNQERPMTIRHALSNSFGFGGTNAVIAMRRWDGE